MTDEAIKALIAQGVADVLAEYEANRGSGNGDDSHNSITGGRRQVPTTRECTYIDFLKCQPLNLKGTESVLGEIKKLEIELWNLKVKGNDVVNYTQRFQELALMCGRMFPEESDEVEKYVRGLFDTIQGSVMASKQKTMQDAIKFATELMDQKIRTFAERQAKNKRKLNNNNQAQQQPPKKQNVAKAYSDGSSEKKEYAGTLPWTVGVLLLLIIREPSPAMNVGIVTPPDGAWTETESEPWKLRWRYGYAKITRKRSKLDKHGHGNG
ncbi:hypothetical protein Tco_0906335 [Tanacetum coccineum]